MGVSKVTVVWQTLFLLVPSSRTDYVGYKAWLYVADLDSNLTVSCFSTLSFFGSSTEWRW